MKSCFIILCLLYSFQFLFADTQVRNTEFKRKGNTLEILLHLENTYDKSPRLTKKDGYRGVIFPSLQAQAYNEKFKNFFINEVQIFNIQTNLYILAVGDARLLNIHVSKAPRAIKIIFHKADLSPSELNAILMAPYKANTSNAAGGIQSSIMSSASKDSGIGSNILTHILSFKNDLNISTWRYIGALAVIAFLILLLWFVKKYMAQKKQSQKFLSLFGYNKGTFDPSSLEVISQKTLDSKHKILTIESNGYRYLILIGDSSTSLIDRHPIPQNMTPDEQSVFDDQFAKILEQKQERLSKYLQNDT